MKVVLTQDVLKLGKAGDVKSVRDGYGRNYLIPQGLAVLATAGAIRQSEDIRQRSLRHREEMANEYTALAARINDVTLTFQAKAGRLFDYLESIEFRELERRFYSIFSLVLGFLVLAVIGLVTVDFQVHQELLRLKNAFVMSAVAVSSFELYFYVDYRMYVDVKTRCSRKRRETFIREIERDFRGFTVQQERRAA